MTRRIPPFPTAEEEAAFWDTHSSADFDDELETVTDVQFTPSGPRRSITVRLDAATLTALTGQARAQGIGPSDLAAIWILERLRAEPQEASAQPSP